jgi:type I restriction enzyme M protein
VKQVNTSEFSDQLPILVDTIRSSGISDGPGELLQVFAGIVLLQQSRSMQPESADYSQLATVEDRADARLALLKLWWRASSKVLDIKAPLPIPRLIASGGNAAARVVESLWNEAEPQLLNDPLGKRSLLRKLEKAIDFWLRESKYAQSCATPQSLADFMVDLAEPQLGEDIYDPCCGIGGLLSRAASSLSQRRASDLSTTQPTHQGRIVGMELNSSLHTVALARILLCGELQPELRIGNTLAEFAHVEDDAQRFDCILANLPFGIRQPKEVVEKYSIHTPVSESLFIQHVLSRLRRGGRAIALVPDSFLFRRGADVNLRRWLLESYSVESVWSVPPTANTSLSTIKTSILVIRNERPRKEIVFVKDTLVGALLDEQHLKGTVASAKAQILSSWATAVMPEAHIIRKADSDEKLARIADIPSALQWVNEHLRQINDKSTDLVAKLLVEESAERSWEILPKRTGVEELQTFFSVLKEHLGRIDLAPLGELADVFSGISYRSEELIRVRGGKSTFPRMSELYLADSQSDIPVGVGLVRVQDVGHSKQERERYPTVRRPLVFLRPEVFTRVLPQHRLNTGDILLTRSGTVGNLGLVDDGLTGAVPAKGIIVIRPRGGYDSLALLRMLQIGPYQNWFQGNASGSVIRHLPTSSVRELVVPRFDNEQQRRLADAVHAGDNIEALLSVFRAWSGEPLWTAFLLHDPAIEWLLKPTRGDGYPAEWWESLRSAIGECDRLAHGNAAEDKIDQVAQSMSVWARHAGRLLDAMEIPEGLERYAALKTWDASATQELRLASTQIGSNSQVPRIQAQTSERLSSICESLMSAADAEANRIADSATLGIELQIRTTPLRQTTDVPVLLINRGIGPLRRVSISIPELGWRTQVSLLRAGESQRIAFSLKPEHRGTQQIRVLWRAEKINGGSLEGREDLSFEVNPTEIITTQSSFQVNPYVTGAPVDTEETFFGREDVIDRVRRLLRAQGPSTVILLEGNRRAGKTSILKRLQKSERLQEWIPVYCQFQGISGEQNAQNLFRLVAREVLNTVAMTPSEVVPEQLRPVVQARSPLERMALCRTLAASINTDRSFELFEELLGLALVASRPRRILLMLDEFETIHQGIERGEMSPLVPENFRYIFQTYPEISGILSGSIRIKRLRKEYWNVLYGIGTPISVGPLSPAAARELVIRPAQGILYYSDQAINRVLEMCGFQPFLIQSLASVIFEACATSKLSSVTTELVNHSAQELVVHSEHFYTVFRQQSLTARQRFLACLIDFLADSSTRVTFDVVRDQLEYHGIPVQSDLQLKADLEDLQEREIIAFVADAPGGHYRIEVPLFSRWLRAKVDFQAERREAIEE